MLSSGYSLDKKRLVVFVAGGLFSIAFFVYYVLLFTAGNPCPSFDMHECEYWYLFLIMAIGPILVPVCIGAYLLLRAYRVWKNQRFEELNQQPPGQIDEENDGYVDAQPIEFYDEDN